MIDIASILGILGGLFVGIACFNISPDGLKQSFNDVSNSESYTPQTSYEYPTKVKYIDPTYNGIFQPLFENNGKNLGFDIGFPIDTSSVSSDELGSVSWFDSN